ncbi:hypothetical protein Ancab_010259 [Ancistrocladus abbreviatus]
MGGTKVLLSSQDREELQTLVEEVYPSLVPKQSNFRPLNMVAMLRHSFALMEFQPLHGHCSHLGLISDMITVGFDNSTYQIRIFEESSRESIFSKGNDRDYIPKNSPPSLPAVPHSLGGVFRSPRGASNSKSMNSNHDNSCRHDPLGQGASQHVPNENAKPNPIDNTTATGLEGSHVSPTACSSARIFMAEGTGNLQRSKKSDHTDTSSVALTL